MNKQKRRSGVKSWKLWIAGWLPAGIGPISWVVAAFRPDGSYGSVSLLGLLTCVAISVIVHELAHFVAAQQLGLEPWCLSIGHGDVVFDKHLARRTLREFDRNEVFRSVMDLGGKTSPPGSFAGAISPTFLSRKVTSKAAQQC
jgi:hypothetical protein